jgi:DNA-binding protein H-NS
MSKTYSQLMKQIETLQREAEATRRKELDGVVERIKEAIVAYGLTAADLGLAARAPKAASAGKKRVGAKPGKRALAAAKYRDDAGNAWGGRGPRPAWLRSALAAGRTLDEFAVK